jgi:hypothetical protein
MSWLKMVDWGDQRESNPYPRHHKAVSWPLDDGHRKLVEETGLEPMTADFQSAVLPLELSFLMMSKWMTSLKISVSLGLEGYLQ